MEKNINLALEEKKKKFDLTKISLYSQIFTFITLVIFLISSTVIFFYRIKVLNSLDSLKKENETYQLQLSNYKDKEALYLTYLLRLDQIEKILSLRTDYYQIIKEIFNRIPSNTSLYSLAVDKKRNINIKISLLDSANLKVLINNLNNNENKEIVIAKPVIQSVVRKPDKTFEAALSFSLDFK